MLFVSPVIASGTLFFSNTISDIFSIMDMLQTFRFSQAVSVPAHRCGHTLDLVVHREEDSLLYSVSVCHSMSSDHLPVMRSLDMSKSGPRPVLRTTRNLRAIDREQFWQDVASLAMPSPTSQRISSTQRCNIFWTRHAPSAQLQIIRCHRSPWYFSIASELRSMKRKRRRAERLACLLDCQFKKKPRT